MNKADNPFRYFRSSPEIIRMVVMLSVRYPRSLRNVKDLFFERGYDFCHKTVGLCRPLKKALKRHEKAETIVRRLEILSSCDEPTRQAESPRDGEVAQQPDGEFTSSIPTTRASYVATLTEEIAAEFASVHASLHNHFNSERHLVDRETFKARRSAVLAERQVLVT